jgi:uncharacterized Fe-S radical SAM superfamily protein PflX
MSYDPPIYERGNTVYLRESAAAGFLEVQTISGVQRGRNTWIYTVTVRPASPHAPHYGERRSLVNGATLFFDECEFIDMCTALELAEAYHVNQLNVIQARLASYCNDTTSTSGTSGS